MTADRDPESTCPKDVADPSVSPYRVGPVNRALKVLSVIGEAQGNLTLGQISVLSGVPRSTVFKYLKTLEEDGFVVQDTRSETFCVGPTLWRLSRSRNLIRLLSAAAGPVLSRLRGRIKETTVWGLLDSGDFCVAGVETGPAPGAVRLQVGTRLPAMGSALGRAALAALPRARLTHLLAKDAARTSGHLERMLADADAVRTSGMAIEEGERDPKVWCCAVPVASVGECPPVALGVLVPRLRGPRILAPDGPYFLPDLKWAAASIARSLGQEGHSGAEPRARSAS